MKCKAFCVVTEHGKWNVAGWKGGKAEHAIDVCFDGCVADGDEYRVIELDFELPDGLFKRQRVTAKAKVRDGN